MMKQKILTISGLISDVDKELDKLVESGRRIHSVTTLAFDVTGEDESWTCISVVYSEPKRFWEIWK